jgi:glycosyltransferase involved in cell wall biosynthesis
MGQRLSRKMGVPLVLEINDPISETLSYYPSPLKKYAALVEKNIIWHAKGVVVGSLALRDYFINQGFPSDKFIVIYPTADYSLFDSSLYSGNISSHAKEFISIGFIGNMRAWHRVDLLLQAFNQVYRNIRNVRLEIVGDGPEMGKIRKVTEDLGIGQVVCFRGSVPYSKIPEVIAGFDICTIPNATWYGSPTKLFEYAAMGKAIVGNSCSPVAEIIEDGKNGFLFDSADPNSLAQALMRLVKDNDLRDMLGERILEKVRTEITWEKNIDKILKVL